MDGPCLLTDRCRSRVVEMSRTWTIVGGRIPGGILFAGAAQRKKIGTDRNHRMRAVASSGLVLRQARPDQGACVDGQGTSDPARRAMRSGANCLRRSIQSKRRSARARDREIPIYAQRDIDWNAQPAKQGEPFKASVQHPVGGRCPGEDRSGLPMDRSATAAKTQTRRVPVAPPKDTARCAAHGPLRAGQLAAYSPWPDRVIFMIGSLRRCGGNHG